MLRIALVDDDKNDLQKLQGYIDAYLQSAGETASVSAFESGKVLLASKGRFDIIMLDIQMDELNGIETARRIRERDEEVIIIFITNMIQYALEGYAVAALDFVLKPIDAFGVASEIEKAKKKLERRKMINIQLKCADGTHIVNAKEICYLEIVGRKLRIRTIDGEYLSNNSMQEMERTLGSSTFFRCHTSYMVNIRYVESIAGNDTIVKGERIPISKHRRKEFLGAVTAYYGERL